MSALRERLLAAAERFASEIADAIEDDARARTRRSSGDTPKDAAPRGKVVVTDLHRARAARALEKATGR